MDIHQYLYIYMYREREIDICCMYVFEYYDMLHYGCVYVLICRLSRSKVAPS